MKEHPLPSGEEAPAPFANRGFRIPTCSLYFSF